MLPNIVSGEQSLDDGGLRESMVKGSLTAILETLRTTNNDDQNNEPSNPATQKKLSKQTSRQASRGVGRRAKRLSLGRGGGGAQVPSSTTASNDASSNDKQKTAHTDEPLSDSESSVASDTPIDTSSRGVITNALGRLLKLASFGTDCVLPNEDKCPELFKTPGAKSAFPRVWKLISDKFERIEENARVSFAVLLSISVSTEILNEKGFPFQSEKPSRRGSQDVTSVSGVNSGPARRTRRNTSISDHESKRNPNVQYVCVFPGCPRPNQLFQDERTFLDHLNDTHCHDRIEVPEKSWICPAVVHGENIPCYESGEELRKHLKAEHKDITDDESLENLISLSIRNRTPVHPAAWCTFCGKAVQSEPGALFRADDDFAQEFPAHMQQHVSEVLRVAMDGVRNWKELNALPNLPAKRRPCLDEKSRERSHSSTQKRRRAK
ncbi:hypothetical protein F4824DRAFT_458321 [Ustulina deusta]|nr:hypothetical protein F4824DRAFT_458321 [Ustulina deusta]